MKHLIVKVWLDDTFLYVRTADGLEAKTPFQKWKRLANATQSERRAYTLTLAAFIGPHSMKTLASAESSMKPVFVNGRDVKKTLSAYQAQIVKCGPPYPPATDAPDNQLIK